MQNKSDLRELTTQSNKNKDSIINYLKYVILNLKFKTR